MKRGKYYDLKGEVIDPGLCVLCGTCTAFCDRLQLDYDGCQPKLISSCVSGCSVCYDHCPVISDFDLTQVFGKTMVDPILGPFTEIKAVRATKEEITRCSKDGGAVTAILSAILDRGKIDAAIVVERDENWRPIPKIVSSLEDILSSAGSKYSPSPNAESLGKVFREGEIKSVAIVDVGCHIRGIRNLEYNLLYNAGFSPYSDLKIYTIGLFCSGSFCRREFFDLLKVRPEQVRTMDIRHGMLTVSADRKLVQPIKGFKDAILPSCQMCLDYTAELADISIGSIGSPEGYSTVIVRNLMGWGMLRDAVQRGFVSTDESLVDLKTLRKAVEKKRERAEDKMAAVS